MIRLILIAAAVALLWAFQGHSRASADHNGAYLPLVPNTPLMQQIKANQSYTYCFNPTAAAYPDFKNQVRDVVARYEERTGIRGIEVAYDASCMVRHDMIQGLQCGGCAGQVFYANWPVVIQYAAQLAYIDWRTTIGHELGHALLGLHEQYDDRAFQCKGQQWTVMDCASGIRYPQPFDVDNGCAILATVWCGAPPPPCNPCYDTATDTFIFSNGWKWTIGIDSWYDPYGRLAFGPKNPEGFRFSPVNDTWEQSGKDLARGEWGRITVP